MSMASKSSKVAFPSHSEQHLGRSVLHEDFGDVAERISTELMRSGGLTLYEIVEKMYRRIKPPASQPSLYEIKSSLLKMLQHNVLDVKIPALPTNDGSSRKPLALQQASVYQINLQEVFYRLRFPRFIELAKKHFGLEGEVIMEELLAHGRIRLDQSLDSMAYQLAELRRSPPEDESDENAEISEQELEESRVQIREVFVEMAKKRFVQRVHPFEVESSKQVDGITGDHAESHQEDTKKNSVKTISRFPSPKQSEEQDKDDSLRVRKRKKRPVDSSAANAIPVELQIMLEAEERAKDQESSDEAEYEVPVRGIKRKRLTKKAKLPSRGAIAKPVEETDSAGTATGAMEEKNLVWRAGVVQLMRSLRHDACVVFARENINNVAGVIVEVMLKHSSPHEREKDEATSHPISARELYNMPEVKEAFPKDAKDTWRLLLNYITVMCRDKSGMIMKVAAESFDATSQTKAADGGQYVVHMKKIVDFLKQSTFHSYLQERFGIQSARIVRLLLERRQLEQKTIGELALLPSNDVRRRLFELYTAKLVKMQEIPKRADHNPAFTFYCWSVDAKQMETRITERIQDSLCRMRRRRSFEAEENKDLIARSEQLVEQSDLAKFDRLSRALDRLDRAIVQLDEMLMLCRDF